MNDINNSINFQKLWMEKLTEKQKIKRIRNAFNILKPIVKKQLVYLDNLRKNNPPNDTGFLYFEKTIENIWENVDYILSVKNKKYRNFVFYPTRCVMESAFRLDHFIKQDKQIQEDIAITECLRAIKRVWDMDKYKNEQKGMAESKKDYDNFINLGDKKYPEIDEIKNLNELDLFPDIFKILSTSKVYDIGLYYHYGFLCELTHGKLFHTIIKNINLISEYRRSLMYLLMMSYRILEVFDVYLFGKVSNEVQIIIKKADKFIKKV